MEPSFENVLVLIPFMQKSFQIHNVVFDVVIEHWGRLKLLTHSGLVMPYGDMDLGQIVWDNGLLPDNTKPLPEPMFAANFWGSVAFTWEQFYSKCPSFYSV